LIYKTYFACINATATDTVAPTIGLLPSENGFFTLFLPFAHCSEFAFIINGFSTASRIADDLFLPRFTLIFARKFCGGWQNVGKSPCQPNGKMTLQTTAQNHPIS